MAMEGGAQPWGILLSIVLLYTAIEGSSSVQHKVGDLDAWGPPPSGKSEIYSAWSQSRSFKIGDSLMFLYPPSQDSVLQVTAAAFESCAVDDPIWKMDDGNSVFNITSAGEFLFISGIPARCQRKQQLRISVLAADGSSPSPGGIATVGSVPAVFGPTSASVAAPMATGIAMAASSLLLVLFFQVLAR
ncbi:early nodulin-like protein 8 [Wolffia australiana]